MIVVAAPPAGADCNYAGGSTVCAQGEVRGADGVPRAATAVRPLSVRERLVLRHRLGSQRRLGSGLGIGGPGIGLPGRPGGIGPRR